MTGRNVVVAAVAAMLPLPVSAEVTQPNVERRRLSPEQVREVAPALEAYTQQRLYGEVWRRPGLSPRDRSLVTVAAMIARGEAPADSRYECNTGKVLLRWEDTMASSALRSG